MVVENAPDSVILFAKKLKRNLQNAERRITVQRILSAVRLLKPPSCPLELDFLIVKAQKSVRRFTAERQLIGAII